MKILLLLAFLVPLVCTGAPSTTSTRSGHAGSGQAKPNVLFIAVVSLAAAIAPSDPASAREWVATISDPVMREEALAALP